MDSILLVCGTVKYGDDDGEGDVTTGSTSFYNTAYPNVATYVASEEKLVAHNVRRAKLIVGNSVPASRTIAGISLQNDITAEELKDALGISNITVISTDRPPMGAPAEVDVDLLKAGDTWLQQGDNIVYKLVETQYNYRPYPNADPYHKFTWQPLNERYGVGNTEPPTSVTYQAVVYTINEVQWSWLPVPEYSQGDHYLMLVDDEPTYYICVSGNIADTGVCTYRWREEGGAGDVSNKMDLAPLNPTAQEIEAMPAGQLFVSDSDVTIGVKTGAAGQSGDIQVYNKAYVDNALAGKQKTIRYENPPLSLSAVEIGDIFFNDGKISRCLSKNAGVVQYELYSRRIAYAYTLGDPPLYQYKTNYVSWYDPGDIYVCRGSTLGSDTGVYICVNKTETNDRYVYTWKPLILDADLLEKASNKVTSLSSSSTDNQYPSAKCVYDMIGDIGSAIDTLNGNIDTLNTNLSEV